jgi:hypothetical protein
MNSCFLRFHLIGMFFLGLTVGAIPMGIKLDQLRRQVDAELAESMKLNEELRAAVADEKQKRAAERADCQNAILGDSGRTVLVDVNHPYGPEIQQLLGVSLTLPPRGNPAFATGPIWVVPRTITPHVVDGVLGGLYTHIWPNGRNDGWHMPARAE